MAAAMCAPELQKLSAELNEPASVETSMMSEDPSSCDRSHDSTWTAELPKLAGPGGLGDKALSVEHSAAAELQAAEAAIQSASEGAQNQLDAMQTARWDLRTALRDAQQAATQQAAIADRLARELDESRSRHAEAGERLVQLQDRLSAVEHIKTGAKGQSLASGGATEQDMRVLRERISAQHERQRHATEAEAATCRELVGQLKEAQEQAEKAEQKAEELATHFKPGGYMHAMVSEGNARLHKAELMLLQLKKQLAEVRAEREHGENLAAKEADEMRMRFSALQVRLESAESVASQLRKKLKAAEDLKIALKAGQSNLKDAEFAISAMKDEVRRNRQVEQQKQERAAAERAELVASVAKLQAQNVELEANACLASKAEAAALEAQSRLQAALETEKVAIRRQRRVFEQEESQLRSELDEARQKLAEAERQIDAQNLALRKPATSEQEVMTDPEPAPLPPATSDGGVQTDASAVASTMVQTAPAVSYSLAVQTDDIIVKTHEELGAHEHSVPEDPLGAARDPLKTSVKSDEDVGEFAAWNQLPSVGSWLSSAAASILAETASASADVAAAKNALATPPKTTEDKPSIDFQRQRLRTAPASLFDSWQDRTPGKSAAFRFPETGSNEWHDVATALVAQKHSGKGFEQPQQPFYRRPSVGGWLARPVGSIFQHRSLAQLAGEVLEDEEERSPASEQSEEPISEGSPVQRPKTPKTPVSPKPRRNLALHFAARDGEDNAVRMLLLAGADAAATDEHGVAPLHLASEAGHEGIVAQLLSSGALPDAATSGTRPSACGITALHAAACRGHKQVVVRLLSAGARPGMARGDGVVPMHFAAQNCHVEIVHALLAAAAPPGDASHAMVGGFTPLHDAVQSGSSKIVVALLAARAEPSHAAVGGTTPLHVAARSGYDDCVQWLLTFGAMPNAVSAGGFRPLHDAAYSGNIGAVKQLISARADVNASAEEGTTPSLLAAQAGHPEVARVLAAAGVEASGVAAAARLAARLGHNEVVQALKPFQQARRGHGSTGPGGRGRELRDSDRRPLRPAQSRQVSVSVSTGTSPTRRTTSKSSCTSNSAQLTEFAPHKRETSLARP
eukprot:TRINITY_DN5752_c0_g1_i2.p1 TRINITY_DN5752_c0_g1~~TRINITY_DN5752_c0_g1_i2.p1  ORF type:complete len:1121 (-),score=260.30 TRINITY_DN5752_c0_g1_i2:122-3382(-)